MRSGLTAPGRGAVRPVRCVLRLNAPSGVSRAAHRVTAVEAAVAGAATDGQGAAVVAGGGVALEVRELLVADFGAFADHGERGRRRETGRRRSGTAAKNGL